jgi:hypothetical protein
LLDPQKYFTAKESYGYISKISASFSRYLIEKYGIDSLKSTFQYGKGLDYEKSHYYKAKKYRVGCLIRWLSDLGKQSLDELEIEYLDYVKNCATMDTNPSFLERAKSESKKPPFRFKKAGIPEIKSHCSGA